MRHAALPALAAAGLLLAGSAWAQPGGRTPAPAPRVEPRPDMMMRHKVVVVDKDGKEHVMETPGARVRRGYLGLGLTDLSPELRTHFGVPEDAGVMVASVEAGSPAEKAGIKVGDIITSLDGEEVGSSWELRARVRDLDEGEQVPLMIWRKGKAQTVSATITLRERPELDMAQFLIRRGGGEHGPMVFEMDPERIRERLPRERLRTPMPPPGGRSPREAELERRLKELEKRLADLEKQLQKQ